MTRAGRAPRAEVAGARYRAAGPALVRISALSASEFAGALAALPIGSDWQRPYAEFLTGQWRRPGVAEAVRHAAPDLADAVERDLGRLPECPRTLRSLGRYINRMSTRSTPFGLLAGVSAATFGSSPSILVNEPAVVQARARLDQVCVHRLESAAADRPDAATRLVVNDLVHFADGYAYQDTGLPRHARDQQPAVLRLTRPVRAILDRAATPACVAELLATIPEVSADRAAALLAGLRRSQILIPAGTGRDGATGDGCRQRGDCLHADIARVEADLRVASGPREPVQAVRRLCQSWAPGYAGPYVHVDAAASLAEPAVLPPAAGRIAAQAATALAAIGETPYPPWLSAFAERFTEHFGQDAEIPVLEALSPSLGVGPPPDYQAPGRPGASWPGAATEAADERDRLLADMVATSLARRRPAIVLDDATVAGLARARGADGRPPAPAADVCLRLGRRPDGGWCGVVTGIAPVGAMTGRFYDLLDRSAKGALDEVVRLEESLAPGYLFAEISYWPATASARNLISRSRSRRLRLLVNTAGGEDCERLTMRDVLVGARERRLHLRHAPTGRPLVVSQSSALLFERAPHACRFLLEASLHQFRPAAVFDWGRAAAGPFTPRLQLGDSVLAPARWRLPPFAHPLAGTDLAGPDLAGFAGYLAGLRETWMIPRHVCLLDHDRRLFLDLDSAPSLDELRRALSAAKSAGVRLEEALPVPGEEFPRDRGGARHACEVVVPVTLTAPAARADEPGRGGTGRLTGRVTPSERHCLPGGEWLAAHVYLPRPQQDRLVLDGLAELADGLRTVGLPGELFFVRYTDPRPHLRVRIRTPAAADAGPAAGALLAWARRWRDRVPICDVRIGSYHREVERYGGRELLPHVESLFCADSRAVTAALRLRQESAGLSRVCLGALTLLRLAQLLVPDPGARIRLLRQMGDAPSGGPQYRDAGPALWRSLHSPGELPATITRVIDEHWAAPARPLRCVVPADAAGTEPEVRLTASLLHMHANRLGLSRPAEAASLGVARRLMSRSLHEAESRRLTR